MAVSSAFQSRTCLVVSLVSLVMCGSTVTWRTLSLMTRNEEIAWNDGRDEDMRREVPIVTADTHAFDQRTTKATSKPDAPQIPHVLFFTYSTNFTDTPKALRDNVQHTIDRYREFWKEPDAPVRYLTNDDCRLILQGVYPSLIPHFDRERHGMYKGDICRVAALWQTGGYYFDVDLRVVQPVSLSADTEFSTCRMDQQGEPTGFFQAFLASRKGHPVLYEALRLTELYYQHKHRLKGDYMGTSVLLDAYNAVKDPGVVHLYTEANLDDKHTAVLYPNVARQQGTGCCCNFIVHDAIERTVYFFSRVPLPATLQKHCMATLQS